MNLEILKIASNTNNFKDLKKYTHYSKIKNSLCGDEIQIKLIINLMCISSPHKGFLDFE